MREIKFRAWDKTGKYKVMCQVINLYSGENPFVQCACNWQDGDVYRWRIFTRSLEQIELMQFTGLLDKSGKKIYEGDILHYPEFADEDLAIHTEPFEWTPYGYQGKFSGENISEGKCEIIGNIYENPELVKP
jgi:hypothetical protein